MVVRDVCKEEVGGSAARDLENAWKLEKLEPERVIRSTAKG